MASKEQSSDPSSSEPSKESAGPSSISDIQPPSETPISPSGPSDFEKIEVISEKSISASKQLPSLIPSSSSAPTVETNESSSCWDSIEQIECNLSPLNVVIFVLAMIVFLFRSVLYKVKFLYWEVLVLALSLMAGAVLTCVAKRGLYAKAWVPSSPKAKRIPRAQSMQDDIPLMPLAPKKQQLLEDVESQQTLEAIIHHEADTESSREASGSSPKSVSFGSDKPFPSASDATPSDSKRKDVPSASDATPSDSKRKDVKSENVKTENPSSSSVAKVYKFLFKKH